MALPKFNTFYDKPVKVNDVQYDKKDYVERAGYVPLRTQIKLAKESGVLLKTTRALAYDTDNELSDFEKVETLTRDVRDYTDMTELLRRAEASSKASELLIGQNSGSAQAITSEAGPSEKTDP